MTDEQYLDFLKYADELGAYFPVGFSRAGADALLQRVRDVGQLLLDSGERDKEGRPYSSYLVATCDAEAAEGSLIDDTHMAAVMLREHATEIGNPLAHEKLAPIAVALCTLTAPYRRVVIKEEEVQ